MNNGQYLAVDASTSTGSFVWWSLSGNVSFVQLAQAWVAAELDAKLLPSEPTPLRALSRAVKDFESKNTLVRSLEAVDEHGAPLDGFSVLAAVKRPGGRTGFEPSWEAWLPPADKLAQGADPLLALSDDTQGEIDEEIAEVVILRYRRELGMLAHSDIASWLVRRVHTMRGIALRQSGGMYFVPVQAMEEWRKWVAVLRKVGAGVVYEAPVLRATEAVEAILDSVLRDAEDEAKALDEVLDTESLGKRALEGRAQKAKAMDAKLAFYEELLGARAEAMRERMNELGARLMSASMRIEG